MNPSHYLEVKRWKVYIEVGPKDSTLALTLEKTPGKPREATFAAQIGDVFRVVVVDTDPARIDQLSGGAIARVVVFTDGQFIDSLSSEVQIPRHVIRTPSHTKYVFDRTGDSEGAVRYLAFQKPELTEVEDDARDASLESRLGKIEVLIEYGYHHKLAKPKKLEGAVAAPKYRKECTAALDMGVSCGLGEVIKGKGIRPDTDITHSFRRSKKTKPISITLRYKMAALPPLDPDDDVMSEEAPELKQDEKPKPSPTELAELAKFQEMTVEAKKKVEEATAEQKLIEQREDEYRTRHGLPVRQRSEPDDAGSGARKDFKPLEVMFVD